MYASIGNKYFSLNLVIFRLTKNYDIKYLKNQNFQKHFLIKVGLLVNIFLERFDQFLTQKNNFESTDFEMFEEVVHNFGKSEMMT